ncbi:MAG TPA: aminoacyl-tRNA deacylase [Anaerolineae bacterium]
MQKKTLAMKVLEGKRVPFEVVPYPVEMRDAEAIAAELGVPAGQLFKTLVVPGTGPSVKSMLVMIPADRQLDLKKLAKAVGVKKLKMASHQEAEALTGLQVGGISALALLNRGFAVYLDTSACQYEQIYVSAGERGLDVKVPVADLVKVTKARFADVTDS